jgi:hypothetical protein
MHSDAACPRCGRVLRVPAALTDEVVTCPSCLAMMPNPHGVRRGGLEAEVRREWSVTSVVLAVLIGLCVVGIILSWIGARATPQREQYLGQAILLALCVAGGFAILDLLVVIAIVRFAARKLTPSGSGAAAVGKALGLVLLLIGAIFGVLVLFFFACVAMLADAKV